MRAEVTAPARCGGEWKVVLRGSRLAAKNAGRGGAHARPESGEGGSECVFLLGGAILCSKPLQPLAVWGVGGGDGKPGMAETLAGSGDSGSGTAAVGPGASEAGTRRLGDLRVVGLRAELGRRSLDTGGSRSVLVERLRKVRRLGDPGWRRRLGHAPAWACHRDSCTRTSPAHPSLGRLPARAVRDHGAGLCDLGPSPPLSVSCLLPACSLKWLTAGLRSH